MPKEPSLLTSKLANLAGKAEGLDVPYTGGLLQIDDLNTPLGRLGTALASDYAQRQFIQPQGEPILSEARAPRYY